MSSSDIEIIRQTTKVTTRSTRSNAVNLASCSPLPIIEPKLPPLSVKLPRSISSLPHSSAPRLTTLPQINPSHAARSSGPKAKRLSIQNNNLDDQSSRKGSFTNGDHLVSQSSGSMGRSPKKYNGSAGGKGKATRVTMDEDEFFTRKPKKAITQRGTIQSYFRILLV